MAIDAFNKGLSADDLSVLRQLVARVMIEWLFGHCSLHLAKVLLLFDTLDVAFLTVFDLRGKFAFFLKLLLFLGPFIPDTMLNLVSPNLVPLKEGRAVPVLMREILACSRHHRCESTLLHLFELLLQLSL